MSVTAECLAMHFRCVTQWTGRTLSHNISIGIIHQDVDPRLGQPALCELRGYFQGRRQLCFPFDSRDD